MPPKRHEDELRVDIALARRLIEKQFPEFADLPIAELEEHGTDHTLYRLGDDMVMRLPIRNQPNHQALREAEWVPFLAPQLPLELPRQIAIGEPDGDYPVQWSIAGWIDGERATPETVDLVAAARDLAGFIRALHACDATGGPKPGDVTFLRGLSLKGWRERIEEWIAKADVDLGQAVKLWYLALDADEWNRPPLWFHGDLPGNLIQRDGSLVGVIDAAYGVGDPACDLMAGWTFFRGEARRVFFDEVGMDDATVARSRGWALGPALIGITYYKDIPSLRRNAIDAIEGALAD